MEKCDVKRTSNARSDLPALSAPAIVLLGLAALPALSTSAVILLGLVTGWSGVVSQSRESGGGEDGKECDEGGELEHDCDGAMKLVAERKAESGDEGTSGQHLGLGRHSDRDQARFKFLARLIVQCWICLDCTAV
jgi:hypothetical protein